MRCLHVWAETVDLKVLKDDSDLGGKVCVDAVKYTLDSAEFSTWRAQSFVPSVKTKLSHQKLASKQDVMSHVWWKY